jgi:type VI secretion system secreted protein VgrG
MRRVICCLWLGIALCASVPDVVPAAGNPVVDTLAQGTVVQLSGTEAISRPFDFDVTVSINEKNLNLAGAIGQPIALTIAPGRSVSGMIERIEQVDGPGAQGLYRLQIIPSAARLKYRTTSRTFYGKTVLDLATQVLNEGGIGNMEARVAASLPAEEMTVQYQESDLAFLSRLLEGAGLHYHIEPTPAGDKFVIGDGNAAFPVSPLAKVVFATNGAPTVFSFSRGQSLHAGQVQAGDYNWKTPAVDLAAAAQAPIFGDLTERVFPAGVESRQESQAAASLRLATRVAGAQVCSGESTYPQLQAGTRVFFTGHPRADFNQEYVITVVEHHRTAKDYRNTFQCLPSQVVFRPQPSTPVPVVAGVVSGIVVGPAGETKFVDQFGRVRVRFPWRSPAHTNPNDPGDAGFVRVAQIATGIGASAMWLPDVGDEVLIAFEYGDPRRPVVVGSVYNAKDMPPAALPANKHLSILRAQSASGAKSELVYDASPGNERLLIQSGQNGLTLGANGIVLQGSSVVINAGTDLFQRAGRAAMIDAGGDLTVKSGQNLTVTSQRDAAVTVAANTNLTIGGALQGTVGSNAQLAVGSNLQVSVGSNMVMDSGKDLSIRAGQHFLLQSAKAARLTAGEDAVIQAGRSLVANAGTLFQFVAAQTGTIQAGQSLLTLQRDGNIEILGKDIAVKASGNLVTKGSKITQN